MRTVYAGVGLFLLAAGCIIFAQNRQTKAVLELPALSEAAIGWLEEGSVWQLRLSGAFQADCASKPTMTLAYFPANADIQVYRERSSLSVCGMQTQNFDAVMELELNADQRYIAINERVWQIERPANDETAPPSLVEIAAFPTEIEAATLHQLPEAPQSLQLVLRGRQTVGCDLPELYARRATGAEVHIRVFNAMPVETVCPAIEVEIDASIAVAATNAPAAALFHVNGKPIEQVEPPMAQQTDKVLTNISRVDVTVMESYPMQISLDVEGEHPDGCDFPVQTRQRREGNQVMVEVFREIPVDVFCPMILKPYSDRIFLEGGFESGEYRISVNAHAQTISL